MKHKHAEAIKAWADGAEIEYRAQGSQEWKPIFEGWSWDNSLVAECRIKPKQPVVRWQWAYKTRAGWQSTSGFYTDNEVVNTSMDRVKLEWTRTEFPE
jgi:hypothetical protein